MTTRTPPAQRSYSTDKACFGISRHLYLANLSSHGAEHRDTLRYSRAAQRDAGFVIAAGV